MIVSERWRTRLAWLLGIALLLRLLTLAAYPLMETTEPRYAEIARKMLESGNWVTPWFDHGVPFWGKPPMSFWGSAATMAVFGVNEFGARLAPFLATLATLALLWHWPRGAGAGRALPLAGGLITVTSLVGFVSAGAVMTDMFMVMGTTLCMVAFWRALLDESARTPWRWAFFVGIAIGLLAKGPVATVITGLALAPWVALRGAWRVTWQRLPWLRGSLLAAALTLPWYLLAESRTPGFLNYFLVGEHLQRFLVSGWSGDLYGHPHTEPRGTIWWFLFAGCMPWTLLLLAAAALLWRQSRADSPARSTPVLPAGEAVYLLCWALATPVFFSMSRNVLPPYVLPGLPAFALLTAILALAAADRAPRLHLAWLAGLLLPVLVTLGLLLFQEIPQARSQRELLQHWHRGEPLAYLGPRPFSAGFYSQGQARWLRQPQETAQWMSSPGPATLVLERSILASLSPEQLQGWNKVAEHADYVMLRRVPGP